MKYSILLKNGRVVDPVNKVDKITDLGINNGKIIDIGEGLDVTEAGKIVDVSNKIVIPGVIDPHMHIASSLGGYPGLKMMAREGVITALDLSGSADDIYSCVRDHGTGMNIAFLNAVFAETEMESKQKPSKEEVQKQIDESIISGALGVKLLGGHYPLSPETTEQVINCAADRGAYTAFHVGTIETGSHLDGLKEAIELSRGKPIHIAHINSYCRGAIKTPTEEASEALGVLSKASNVWSESYLNLYNGCGGQCVDGRILSEVTKRCCRIGGFKDNEAGLEEAIRSGFCCICRLQGGEIVHITGEEGRLFWRQQGTNVTLSFPVNSSQSQFLLATMKNPDGNFIVDAIATDGGAIPRNTMVTQGLSLVRFGALSINDFVKKTSVNAARMMGLEQKGHLSSGADADITVLDFKKGCASMGIALGNIIMIDGIVVGTGGTIITTESGKDYVSQAGVPYYITDLSKALINKNA